MSILSPHDPYATNRDRKKLKYLIYLAVLGITSVTLLANLFKLQVMDYSKYKNIARDIVLRSEHIIAQRGRIYDRNVDEPLAINIDSFAVYIVPANAPNISEEYLSSLEKTLEMEEGELLRMIPREKYKSYQQIEIKQNVPFGIITYIAEHVEAFPGVVWENKALRYYTYTGSISHVLGYVGNINEDELDILYNKKYSSYSVLGKSGIEKYYDKDLRGIDGSKTGTVDARGRRMGREEINPPTNGYDVVLTIDRHVQQLAEKALGPRNGAVVVLKPATGEVLAMASYPYFNPNKFDESGPEGFRQLSLNRNFPFLNRAIQSSYPAASTFKIVMAAAILEEDGFPADKTVLCSGVMKVGNRYFHCHKRSGHGRLDLAGAVAESCNVYFGTVGWRYLKANVIAEYGRTFGLGEPTGIDLLEPGQENSGIIPTPTWKQKTFNTPWTGGDTVNMSIGQGFLSVTPLQMTTVLSVIANGGVAYKPHILKELRDPENGKVIKTVEPELLLDSYLDKETTRLIGTYLRRVVTSGTAQYVMMNEIVDVAGKTGTGELGSKDSWHDWFVSYAPYQTKDPSERIVVVVLVEGTNTWQWWAPKATDIIYKGYFDNLSYEEVLEEYQKKGVWYLGDIYSMEKEKELEREAAQR